MTRSKFTHSCDLCGEEMETPSASPPPGWVRFAYEPRDRMFVNKDVCPACQTAIACEQKATVERNARS